MTTVRIVTCGTKHREPPRGDINIDCRILRNPHFDPALRNATGKDQSVQDYVRKSPSWIDLYNRSLAARPGQTVVFYCVGGKHRSVAMAEMAAKALREMGRDVSLTHCEI